MTVSLWQRTSSLGTISCDVLVVGGGVCGLSAALHLQRRGVDARLVERHTIGSGASGRNAGFLMRGCADSYADAVREYGRERARALWKLTEDNLAGLRAEGIDSLPWTRRVPSVLLALKPEELGRLRESVTLLREDGFSVDWQEPGAASAGSDSVWQSGRVLGALVNPHDGACHSMQVLRLLAGKLAIPMHERQEVAAIEEGDGQVRVRTTDATIIARQVLVCTNAYASLLLPSKEGVITPRRGQVLIVRRREGSLRPALRLDASYYANFGSEYFRQLPDGSILMGGCRTYHAERELGFDDRTTPWVQEDLEQFVATYLGGGSLDDLEVTMRWAGTVGFTRHHLPVIMPVRDAALGLLGRRVWFVGGFTGHGMSMAYEVSRIAVSAMLDGTSHIFVPADH